MARRDTQDALARLDGLAADLEQRVGDARKQSRLSEVAAEKAEDEKSKVVAAEAAGELSAEQARKAYEEADATVLRHRREAERFDGVASEHERALEKCRADLARVEFELARETAEAKHAATVKASARLGEQVTAAVAAATALTKARDAEKAAFARARELCPAEVELDWPESPEWLPAGTKELVALIEQEAKRLAEERATVAAVEKGRREQAQTMRRELTRRYAWSGDEDVLDEIRALPLPALAIDEAVAEAAKAHAAVRVRCAPAVERILDQVRQGRTPPASALNGLGRMSDVPDDLRAEAARQIEALAGPEMAKAKAFAEMTIA